LAAAAGDDRGPLPLALAWAAAGRLLLGCLVASAAIGIRGQDEIEGVFPQVGTGAKDLQDSKVVGHLKTAFENVDKSEPARAAAAAPPAAAAALPLSRGKRADAA
jgi:hypothetical protein